MFFVPFVCNDTNLLSIIFFFSFYLAFFDVVLQRNESEKKIIIKKERGEKTKSSTLTNLRWTALSSGYNIYTHFYNKHRLLCFVMRMNRINDSNRVVIVKKKDEKSIQNRIIRIFLLQSIFFFSFLLKKKKGLKNGCFYLRHLFPISKIKKKKFNYFSLISPLFFSSIY